LDVAELTTDVPEEFRGWIDSLVRRFRGAFDAIEGAARVAMDGYAGEKNIVDAEQKKAFALYVLERHKELSAILFAMIGGKRYDAMVWKMIRPRGDEEKTFRVDEP